MARKKKKTIPELCVWKGCFVKWYWYTGYWYLRFEKPLSFAVKVKYVHNVMIDSGIVYLFFVAVDLH